MESSRLAVHLRNVHFRYENTRKMEYALQGVDIHVPEGVIYALLGPSACGKTTTLKVLAKMIKPCEGQVSYPCFEKPPQIPGNAIGFMPQETALYSNLTIKETLSFFAGFHGISGSYLQNRIDKLIDVFDLPHQSRFVGTLSGGQRRRVSLIVALIHDPKIVILDEPTVGVDPILRRTVWQYLIRITAEQNKTVILTTHYIDEAKEANVIALMRSGLILKECSPSQLMKDFKEISLEACFYKVCVAQELDDNHNTSRNVPVPTLEYGIASVYNGENYAAIHFKDNFTRCLVVRTLKAAKVDNATLNCGSVRLYMDRTNQIISFHLERSLYESMERFMHGVLEDIGAPVWAADIPLKFVEPIYGLKISTFSEYFTPSILLATPYVLSMTLTGLTLLLERESGVFHRIKINGSTNSQIFLAQFITNAGVVAIQVLFMLLIQFTVFDTVLLGSWVWVIAFTLLQGICGMVLGLFLSAVVNNISTGIFLGLGVFLLPSLFLCGLIWPLEGMPTAIRYVAYFLPLTYTNVALRSVMSKGFGIGHLVVWLGALSVVSWIIIFTLLAIFAFRKK